MRISNISERAMRYALTFLIWNNMLSLFLSLAIYRPGINLSFFECFICVLIVSHVCALSCLLAVDISKSFLLKRFSGIKDNLYFYYTAPVSIVLIPGLIAGYYASLGFAWIFGINWRPDLGGIIRPGILFGCIVVAFNLLFFNWISSLRAKYQKESELKTAQNNLLESKLQILMSELNPHLLFNSLNMIVEVLRDNSVLAEKMLLDLCDYYQQILISFDKKKIFFKEELELCKKYLALQESRHPNLHFEFQLYDAKLQEYLLPPLILQPLIENSLKHGFRDMKKSEAKKIIISAASIGDRMQIRVFDNGSGDKAPGEAGRAHLPQGLRNCERRLQLFFDESCAISLTKDHEGTTVLLDMPYANQE